MLGKIDRLPWTTQSDLRSQVLKLWDSGHLLASVVTGERLFPKRLTLRKPTSREIVDRFDEVRTWIGEIRGVPHCRLEMRRVNHRVFGENDLPYDVWIDSIEDALAFIGKSREFVRFCHVVETTRNREPQLINWLAKRPHRALELFDSWERLLSIVEWVKRNPRPGLYLREVDLAGVHSKFVEGHRGVLSELLDAVLPPEAIDAEATGADKFARRYGFADKPLRVRFRILDPGCCVLNRSRVDDVTLDADSFAQLDAAISRVFITENEINFLAFPRVRHSIVLFGAGYGFEMLSNARWLSRCQVFYWGDIDTHGFAILDQLRGILPNTRSFLMDRSTLMKFSELWGEEPEQTTRDLARLNSEESTLYDDLRDNRIRPNLRLEQERIGFHWVESFLATLNDPD